MRGLFRFTIILVIGAAAAAAQSDSPLPSIGLLFDSDGKNLRQVWGIPGSAFYGAPLDLQLAISAVAVAPAQDAAVASTPDGIFVVRLKNGAAAAQQVNGPPGNPDVLVLSPRGQFAAAYYRDRQVLTIIVPLSADTPASNDVSAAAIAATPDALAITDDGHLALALVSTGGDSPSTDVITLDTQSGNTQRIFGTPHGTAAGFLPGTSDAVLADDVSGSVFLVRDVAGSAQQTMLLSGEPRLTAPSGLQITSDGKRVLAVSASSGSLAMLDLGGADPAFMTCKCHPAGVRSLSGNTLFQIAPLKDGIAWIVEWDPDNPRILFIPPEIAGDE
jgi:hypothetical protein